MYECQAINPVGIVTRNFTLLVVGKFLLWILNFLSISVGQLGMLLPAPPKFISYVESKKTIIEGSNITLPCQVYAMPPPSITWLLNGVDLSVDGGKYAIENDALR